MASKFLDNILKKILFIVFLILTSFSIFYFLIFKPQYQKYLNIKNEIKKSQALLTYSEMKAANLDSLKKDIDYLKQNIISIKTKLPRKGNIPDLIKIITNLSKEKKLDNISIKQGEIKSEKDCAMMPLEISLKGSYHNLGEFIFALRNYSWMSNISGLNIASADNKNNSELTINITLQGYLFLQSVLDTTGLDTTGIDSTLIYEDKINNDLILEIDNYSEMDNYFKNFTYKANGRRDPFKSLPIPPPPQPLPIVPQTVVVPPAPKEVEVKKVEPKLLNGQAQDRPTQVIEQEVKKIEPKHQEVVPPPKKEAPKPKATVTIPDINVAGILWNPDDPMVMIQNDDRILKEGMTVDSENKILIRKINKDNVVFEKTEAGVTVTRIIGVK